MKHRRHPQELGTIEPPGCDLSVGRPSFNRCLSYFQGKDIQLVRVIAASARKQWGRRCAIAVSTMGNGWFYPIYAVLVFIGFHDRGPSIVVIAGFNIGLSHIIYPLIKKWTRRERPFRADASVNSLLPV